MNRYKKFGSKRTTAMGAIFALFISLLALQANAPVSNAQGGFSSAIIELIPGTFGADGAFTPGGAQTISSVLAQAGSGAFYIEGVAVQNRAIFNCTLPSGDLGTPVNFSGPGGAGRRVGIWRMWGFRPGNTGINSAIQPTNSITGGAVAVVNMSIDLDSFNGSLELQGTLGRVFGAVESAGPSAPGVPTDVLGITGGTRTFRSASGDALITPLFDSNRNNCPSGAFQLSLREGPRFPPRFGNLLP